MISYTLIHYSRNAVDELEETNHQHNSDDLKTRMIENMRFEEQIKMLSTISKYFDCRTIFFDCYAYISNYDYFKLKSLYKKTVIV